MAPLAAPGGAAHGNTPTTKPGSRPPFHVRAPAELSEKALTDAAVQGGKVPKPLEKRTAFRAGVWAVLVLALLLLGGGGFSVWWFLLRTPSEPAAPSKAQAQAKPSVVSEASSAAANAAKQVASLPSRLIDHAKESMDARRDLEQQRIDLANEGKGDKTADTAPTPKPTTTIPPKVSAQTAYAGTAGSTAVQAVAGEAGAPEPSPAFRRAVEAMRISGVFAGDPPRVLIDGKVYRPGDLINPSLGIQLDSVEDDGKTVRFVDGTGAKVEKPF